ncbi:MAG: DNA polymerase III subunit gamma/tau [Patescibacteria group bacterium]
MVFYRTYRPKNLAELDNLPVAEQIRKYLTHGSIPHAFLLTGPKGTGKTSTARIIAKCINCSEVASLTDACGKCDICLSIARGENLDVLEIDAASNRGIDEIRDLREKIKLSPANLKRKVYIIDEVHMLTNEAFNALLKTLEEPPAHVVFILATTELHKVPDTIVSRCVRVHFQKAAAADLIRSLARIVAGEKLAVKEDILAEIAGAADGSFRDGAKLLEELIQDPGPLTLESVRSKAGFAKDGDVSAFVENLRQKSVVKLLETTQNLNLQGLQIRQFFLQVMQLLEQELTASFSKTSVWDKKELLRAIHLFSESFSQLKYAVIPVLPFEVAVVLYCEGGEPEPSVRITSVTASTPHKAAVTDASAAPIANKWAQILDVLKPYNHSIAGVLRSCRPVSIVEGCLIVEADYKFHADRLNDPKVHDMLAKTIKDVVGFDVKIETTVKKR